MPVYLSWSRVLKTFYAGNILRCPVGIVTKGCDNQRDLTTKIIETYLSELSQFHVEALAGSAVAGKRVIQDWGHTTFVMAATEPQLKTYLEAMATLQSTTPRPQEQASVRLDFGV